MNCHRLVRIIASAACFSIGQWAAAASIHFDPPATSGLQIGDRFTLAILGSDFADSEGSPGSAGGGLDLNWDPAVLSIASLADIELLFASDRSLASDGSNNGGKGALDAAGGLLRDLSVLSLLPVTTQDFTIAKITFTATGTGTSAITLATGTYALGGRDVWTSASGTEEIATLTFSAASATVAQTAVPLPAAAVLFSSALALLSLQRRKPLAFISRD